MEKIWASISARLPAAASLLLAEKLGCTSAGTPLCQASPSRRAQGPSYGSHCKGNPRKAQTERILTHAQKKALHSPPTANSDPVGFACKIPCET